MLGGGRSSKTGGELSKTEGRLSGIGGVETSEVGEEESSGSGDCPLGASRISSVIVTKEEETSSSAGKDCIRSEEMVMSR